MQPSFSLALSRVEWSVFGTLTFKVEPSESLALRTAESWLNRTLHRIGVSQRNALWVLRSELGEAKGRQHLHLLINVPRSRIGFFVVAKGRVSFAVKSWKTNGISRFRLVEGGGRDSAVSYITKDIDVGADVYEISKTSRAQRLFISRNALKCMRKGIGRAVDDDRATNTLTSQKTLATNGLVESIPCYTGRNSHVEAPVGLGM